MTETVSRKVLVDMDGVLFDFDREVRRRLEIRHPGMQPLQLDPPDFYTANNYAGEQRDMVWAMMTSLRHLSIANRHCGNILFLTEPAIGHLGAKAICGYMAGAILHF